MLSKFSRLAGVRLSTMRSSDMLQVFVISRLHISPRLIIYGARIAEFHGCGWPLGGSWCLLQRPSWCTSKRHKRFMISKTSVRLSLYLSGMGWWMQTKTKEHSKSLAWPDVLDKQRNRQILRTDLQWFIWFFFWQLQKLPSVLRSMSGGQLPSVPCYWYTCRR